MDVKNAAGKAILRELVPNVDVLVQNYAPGVIGRMGFDYESVRKLNPRIIMCSVSTFGQSGPLATNPGYDFIGQAYAGVTAVSGSLRQAHSQTRLIPAEELTRTAYEVNDHKRIMH